MFRRRSRRNHSVEQTEPELPITPMLDMSFQLMFFFVLTYRPLAAEGQIALQLPRDAAAATSTVSPTSVSDLDPDLKVQIYATDTGGVAQVTTATETGRIDVVGPDSAALLKFLKEKAAEATKEKKGIPRLQLEFADRLSYQFVLKILGEAKLAGYERLSPKLLPVGAVAPPKAAE